MEEFKELAIKVLQTYGLQVIGAIAALIIGLWVVGRLTSVFKKMLEKRNVDSSLRPFLGSLVSTLLKIMLFMSVLSMVGIEVTSFVAIFGAAGLAIGMALSGTLQNFAGGVMILLFKPFKEGDVVEMAGYTGSVNSIQIFNTYLRTPDNKVIIIPNGSISSSSLTNYTMEDTRRVDWTFGIAYGDSVEKAREVLLRLIKEDERIFTDPEPFIGLAELGDSSVNLAVRVWANTGDYWGIFFDMNEKVYKTFEEEGLSIPFPQMDVHLNKVEG